MPHNPEPKTLALRFYPRKKIACVGDRHNPTMQGFLSELAASSVQPDPGNGPVIGENTIRFDKSAEHTKVKFADPAQHESLTRACYFELAAAMARNSIYQSVEKARYAEVCSDALTSFKPGPQPFIVVVVGAGASHAASGLPRGEEAANHLRAGINGALSELVSTEIEKLSLQFNLDTPDFETILLAISKYDRRQVIQKLNLIFGRRHHPWLGYELLAHCLKHRFVDAVINFNFDEILDQAIEDEVGVGAFQRVVLDGDCPTDIGEWLDNKKGGFKLPLYIKPHGSASQPSSMRFTRESYTAMPEDFVSFLDAMLSVDRPIYILVAGFSMQSIEFNYLLRRAAFKRPHGRPMQFFFVETQSKSLKKFAEQLHEIAPKPIFPSESIPIDVALESIWKLAFEQFDERMRPRNIERHQLISYLFEYRKIERWKDSLVDTLSKSKNERLIKYFRQRTLVEIVLAVAKAKGITNLESLANTRAGTYYSLYRTLMPKPGGDHTEKLNSLGEACEQLGLRLSPYGSLVILDPTGKVGTMPREHLTLSYEEFKDRAPQLTKRALALMFDTGTEELGEAPNKLTETLLAMYRGEEVEVSTRDGVDRTLFFRSARILTTLSSLKYQTKELFDNLNFQWDAVVCSAESGRWLCGSEYVLTGLRRNDATIALVVADMVCRNDLITKFGDSLVELRKLHWWLHNHHVTVFLQQRIPRYAISFERRMRTARIAPIYVDTLDVNSCWETFAAYWLKAGRIFNSTPERPIVAQDMESAKAEILTKLYPASERLDGS